MAREITSLSSHRSTGTHTHRFTGVGTSGSSSVVSHTTTVVGGSDEEYIAMSQQLVRMAEESRALQASASAQLAALQTEKVRPTRRTQAVSRVLESDPESWSCFHNHTMQALSSGHLSRLLH